MNLLAKHKSLKATAKRIPPKGLAKLALFLGIGILLTILCSVFSAGYFFQRRAVELVNVQMPLIQSMLEDHYAVEQDKDAALLQAEDTLYRSWTAKPYEGVDTVWARLYPGYATILYDSATDGKQDGITKLSDPVYTAVNQGTTGENAGFFLNQDQYGRYVVHAYKTFVFQENRFAVIERMDVLELVLQRELLWVLAPVLAGMIIVTVLGVLLLYWPLRRALRTKRNQTLELLEQAGVGVCITSEKNNTLVYVNEQFEKMFGQDCGELEELWDFGEEITAIKPGRSVTVVHSAKLDKRFAYFRSPMRWRRKADVRLEAYVGLPKQRQTVTETMKIRAAVVESADILITAYDRDLNCIYSNLYAREGFGMVSEETDSPVSWCEIYDSESAETMKEKIAWVAKNGEAWQGELGIVKPDGTKMTAQHHVFPIYDESNTEMIGVGSVAHDVAQIATSEGQFSAIGERLETVPRISDAGVWEIDHSRGLVAYDSNVAGLFGLDKEQTAISIVELAGRLEQILPGGNGEGRLQGFLSEAIGNEQLHKEIGIALPNKDARVVGIEAWVERDGEGEATRTVGLAMDITKRHEAEKQLLDVQNQAQRAGQTGKSFLFNMSDEIQIPMNSIMDITQTARASDDVEEIRGYLNKVETASAHLLSIISDLVDLSKIESGDFELANERFDLENLMAGLADGLSAKTGEKQQELFVEIKTDTPCRLRGDAVWLSKVMMNLATNAAELTPTNGMVRLYVAEKACKDNMVTLEICVGGDGTGISQEQSPQEAQAVAQADDSGTAKGKEARGLKLELSKRIIKMMGGDIAAESMQGDGQFAFTIKANIADEEKKTSVQLYAKPGTQLRALVADDSSAVRGYMQRILTAQGFSCTVASGGFEAVRCVENALKAGDPYNVVFLDLRMEGMDGIETAQKIRGTGHVQAIVMMASAYERQRAETEAQAAGIDGFLPKPVLPSLVARVIHEVIDIGAVTKNEVSLCAGFDGKHVLLVEHSESSRERAKSALQPTGVQISEACDGLEAVKLFEKNGIDLILMDVQMPVIDGYAITRIIRESANPHGKTVPIVAMIESVFLEDIPRALACGMDSHIEKPIDAETLLDELGKYFGHGEDAMASLASESAQEDTTFVPVAEPCHSVDDIVGIDVKVGLDILESTRLYIRLLNSFAVKNNIGEFLAAVEEKNGDEMAAKANVLKGVCANLALSGISDIIRPLEARAQQGDYARANDPEIAQLKEVYEKTLASIELLNQNPDLLEKLKKG